MQASRSKTGFKNPPACLYLSRSGAGKRKEIREEIKDILNRQKPDMQNASSIGTVDDSTKDVAGVGAPSFKLNNVESVRREPIGVLSGKNNVGVTAPSQVSTLNDKEICKQTKTIPW